MVEKWKRVRENPHSCAALLEAVKKAILDVLFGFKPGDKRQSNPDCFCGVVFYVIVKVEQSGRVALHLHGGAALAAFCIERLRGLFAGPNSGALALAHGLCSMWMPAPYYNLLPDGQPNLVHNWSKEESDRHGQAPPLDDKRCPAAAYNFLVTAGATPAQHKAAKAAAAGPSGANTDQQPQQQQQQQRTQEEQPPDTPATAAGAATAQPAAPAGTGTAIPPVYTERLTRTPPRRRTAADGLKRVPLILPCPQGLPPLPDRERLCCQHCGKVVGSACNHTHSTTCQRHGCLGNDKDCGMIFPRILRELFRWIGQEGTFMLPRSGAMQVRKWTCAGGRPLTTIAEQCTHGCPPQYAIYSCAHSVTASQFCLFHRTARW